MCACVRVRERALLCAHHATCFAAGPIALNRLASASAARSQISTLFSSSDTVIAIELGSRRVPRNAADRAARAGEDFLEARRFGDVVDVHCERRAGAGRAAHTASSTR